MSYEKVISGALLSNFNEFYFSANRFLKNHPQSNLYPKYLENHGYLPNSYGFSAGSAYNWTKNRGWIGQWGCRSGKGECFGVGIVGNISNLKPIIQKYQSQARQIFFPFPEHLKNFYINLLHLVITAGIGIDSAKPALAPFKKEYNVMYKDVNDVKR